MAKKSKAKKRAPARAKATASARPKAKKVSAVPAGYHTATPYLTVHDGAGALEFYKRALGAREVMRMAAPGGKIHLKSATVEQLDELPGVGPVTAQQILSYREANGAFRSIDELDAVPGIGPARLEQLRPLVDL